MDIYLLGQDDDWTYTFGGKIKQVYIFEGKIMQGYISLEAR